MQLVLERRPERSAVVAVASPLIAVVLTIITFAILFAIMGKNPVTAIWVYFIEPLTDPFALQEIAVKATPLVMIAVGLALCYIANIWNIGAEGQFIVGAVCGSWLAVRTNSTDVGHWVLPAMLVLAALGGALYALIPAIFRVYFGASEILTSLMLVYVADLFLLSRARSLARSAGLQLSDHGGVRSCRYRPGADRRRPAASRRHHRAAGRGGRDGHARAHHQGL